MSAAAAHAVAAQQIGRATQKAWLTGICLAAADTIAVVAAALGGVALDLWHPSRTGPLTPFLPGAATLLVFALLGLYPVVALNPALECQRILLGSSVGFALGIEVTYLRQPTTSAAFGRSVFVWLATVFLVFTCRSFCRRMCCKLSWWGTPTVLFGSGPEARAVLQALQCTRSTCLKIVAVLDSDPIPWPELDRKRIHVSTPEHAAELAAKCGISHAIIAMPALTGAEIAKIVRKHAASFSHVLVITGLNGLSSVWAEPCAVGGLLGLHVTQTLLHRRPQLVKRALDLLVTAITGLALLPVFVTICLAIWASSRGPIFYGHVRIGLGNSNFKVWKFRTMHPKADQILSAYLGKSSELRREWERDHKLRNDPRVTLIGKVLRKTSLDELPQLWNVLMGEMSFVGPRPIVAAEVVRYGKGFDAYSSVRPGLTGLWQVSGRNDTSYEQRIQLDEYYVRNWSVWLDLYILGRTLKTVMTCDGAY